MSTPYNSPSALLTLIHHEGKLGPPFEPIIHAYDLRKRKVREPDHADVVHTRPRKRIHTVEHTAPPLSAALDRTRKRKAPDNSEPLKSRPTKHPRIEQRNISPFESLMCAPLPSNMLSGQSRDRMPKRKILKSTEDSVESVGTSPSAGKYATRSSRVSAGIPMGRSQPEEEISGIDMGQAEIAFISNNR